MKRNLTTKLALAGAASALALGAVACEVDDAVDPGFEDDPLLDEEPADDL